MADVRVLRVSIERAGHGTWTSTVTGGKDAKDVLDHIERELRALADSARAGHCGGFIVTVHAAGEDCDHE